MPSTLRTRILDAVTSDPPASSDIPKALEETANRLLERAKSGSPSRETALDLLAADALITFALEAQGEADPRRLIDIR